jgi:protein-S-isoprenylcysteine O-methyltransferase Ste14
MIDAVTQKIHWFSWGLVAFYCLLATMFVYGLLRPRQSTEWRNFGIAWAWVVALYAEMYGVPLTLYVLASWVGPHLAPGDDFQLGHLWAPLLGLDSPYWNLLFTVVGKSLVVAGAVIALVGWRHLWPQRDEMACKGIYRYVRHPQYSGFFLFVAGSLINWPTIATLVMAPILIVVYYRLALSEERTCLKRFGDAYVCYAAHTPCFITRVPFAFNIGVAASQTTSPT